MLIEPSGLSLREATPEDEPFLLELYASTRSDELEGLNWAEDQKRAFMKMQFQARERSYPQDGNKIVLLNGKAIGRIHVDRTESVILLRDIALLKEHRNCGIGSRLITDLMSEATSLGRPIRLHVFANSPAVRLYERLGFCKIDTDAAYLEMRLDPSPAPRPHDSISD